MISFYELMEKLNHYNWVTMDSGRHSGPNKVDLTPDPYDDPFYGTRPSDYEPKPSASKPAAHYYADPFYGTRPSDYEPPKHKPNPALDAAFAQFTKPTPQKRRLMKKKK